MTENKFNTYLTFIMLTNYDAYNGILESLFEEAEYVKITDDSVFGKDYVTIDIGGRRDIVVRKRRN